MKKDDRNALDRVIKECVASGLPGLEAGIRRARGALMGMEYAPSGGVSLSFNIFQSKFNTCCQFQTVNHSVPQVSNSSETILFIE